MKGDIEGAKLALQRLRGRENVDDELEEMKGEKDKRQQEQQQSESNQVYTIKMLIKDKANHLPLAATVALQVQPWSFLFCM